MLGEELPRLFAGMGGRCVLGSKDMARTYAFCMGRHKRLGVNSAVSLLPVEIIQRIFEFVGTRRLSAKTFFDVYHAIFSHCTEKPVDQAGAPAWARESDLYDYIRFFLENHCGRIRVRLLATEPVRRTSQMNMWESMYATASKWLTLLFRYFERHWIVRQQEEDREILPIMALCSTYWHDLVVVPVHESYLLPALQDHDGGLQITAGIGILGVKEQAAVNEVALVGTATASEAALGELVPIPHSRVVWEDDLPTLLDAVTLRSSDGIDFIVGIDSGLAQMSTTINNMMKCTQAVPISTL